MEQVYGPSLERDCWTVLVACHSCNRLLAQRSDKTFSVGGSDGHASAPYTFKLSVAQPNRSSKALYANAQYVG